jgi:chromate reductase, NAD(P)H dehydrogenase (quinone)
MFTLSHAHQAFDEAGRLQDAATADRLKKEITGFLRLAEAVAPVCSKSATAPDKARTKQIAEALENQSQLQPR